MLFEGIIYKQTQWFDSKERAPGILSSVLSADVSKLNGLSTETIAVLSEAIATFAIGVIMSLIFSWRIGLVCIAASPFVFVGAALMSTL